MVTVVETFTIQSVNIVNYIHSLLFTIFVMNSHGMEVGRGFPLVFVSKTHELGLTHVA